MPMLRGIPKKREFLARSLARLGVLGLLERAAATRGAGLVVFTYHRIAEPGADPFYAPVISATPDSFREQVNWLRDHVHFVTLDDLAARLEGGCSWSGLLALLTFDDGYRDNFDVAAPILRECGVPATFFISTRFLDAPGLPWWDQVAYAINQVGARRLTLERSPGGGGAPPIVIDLQTESRATAITAIIGALLEDTVPDLEWFLDQLATEAGVIVDHDRLGRGLFMSWDQVRQLADSGAGFAVGSHTHSHHKLATLDDAAQRYELWRSKQLLEAHINRAVEALAYPFGWAGSYTARTRALAAEAGYRLAFAGQERMNRPGRLDRYEVCRLSIGSADSLALIRSRAALHALFGASFL
jgi:peptidoglycan/xylan/chitin deacetylase (PgdA/CDA1 family)